MTSLDHVAVAGTDISQQKWRPDEAGALAVEGKLCPGAGFDVLNSFLDLNSVVGPEQASCRRIRIGIQNLPIQIRRF
jgi:hypothetical protein